MVQLYFYNCPKKNQHSFWQNKLTELLQNDYGICNPQIITTANGKPVLQNDEIFFNISHSRDTLVIAVADVPVGVDIEFERKISQRVREYCLSDEEIKALPDDTLAFLRIWTAKESYLKLYGTGLRQPMREFSVLGDRFSGSLMPSAVFTRIERDGFTLCVATEKQENIMIKSSDVSL